MSGDAIVSCGKLLMHFLIYLQMGSCNENHPLYHQMEFYASTPRGRLGNQGSFKAQLSALPDIGPVEPSL